MDKISVSIKVNGTAYRAERVDADTVVFRLEEYVDEHDPERREALFERLEPVLEAALAAAYGVAVSTGFANVTTPQGVGE